MTSKTRILISALGATAVLAIPASAADPDRGTVSLASPNFDWTGSSSAYGVYSLYNVAYEAAPCEAPFCDELTLEVADQADLVLTVDNNAPTGPGSDSVTVDVVKPDGSIVHTAGEAEKPAVVRLKNTPTGSYEIRVRVNNTMADPSYKGNAKLGSGAVAVTPPPGGEDTKPNDPNVNPPQEPQEQQPAATLRVRTTKGSLKKSRKGLKVGVATSSPVTNVRAALKKGKKVVGRGKLAKLDKSATMKLKLAKRLKPGRYVLALTARDGDRTVGVSANFKLKR